MVLAILNEYEGDIGPGWDDRAELTQAELTKAYLTQGRVDPHLFWNFDKKIYI